MSQPVSSILVCSLLCVLSCASGVWLSSLGTPPSTIVLTVHKLLALATVIAIAVTVTRLFRTADARTIAQMSVACATGVLFLGLFVSGALLSLGKPAPTIVLRIHQVAPVLALLASAATVYLLTGSRS